MINLPTDFSLHQVDALELLRGLPDASVDLIVTDPAYQSLEKHRVDKNGKNRGRIPRLVTWFSIFPNERFDELFAEAYRVLKKGGHLYMFSDQETMFIAKPKGEAVGFKLWKPIVWDKKYMGMGYHYRARCEFVLFFEKGKRKLNNLGTPDVLKVPRILGGYPTEKPVALMEILISQSSNPGDVVLDPFCGSGSVGVAALKLGRRFIGGDTSDVAMKLSMGRLEDASATSAQNSDAA